MWHENEFILFERTFKIMKKINLYLRYLDLCDIQMR